MLYEVLARRSVPPRGAVLADEVIRRTGLPAADRCSVPLRQVTIWDETQQRRLMFLTNLMHLAASTIAAIDTERWQIELRVTALTQRLKIKTFVGTSENAGQLQL
jgi:IS4 transposase